jgi:hypothetical protein
VPRGPIGANPTTPEQSGQCFATPGVRQYLGEVRQKMIDAWELPGHVTSDEEVSLQFLLGDQGELQELHLLAASNEALGRSAVAAMRTAAPFGMPPAACLTTIPITATFSNPEEE